MPVAIVGPGRSGTSLVARALNLCGLYLGGEQAIMPPGPGNPDGYWEHLGIVALNDALLEHFGGGWDSRPANPDWASPELGHFRAKACELIESLDGHPCWGWKDPRTSFTLPFWQALVPELSVVMCIRHPFQVAASLNKQHYTSIAYGLRWWKECVGATLSADNDPVMVAFDAVLAEPAGALGRLASACGLELSGAAVASVRSRITDCTTGSIPPDAQALYELLLGKTH
jgi:hypothetical protein